jgi:hypothetical protein
LRLIADAADSGCKKRAKARATVKLRAQAGSRWVLEFGPGATDQTPWRKSFAFVLRVLAEKGPIPSPRAGIGRPSGAAAPARTRVSLLGEHLLIPDLGDILTVVKDS